MDVFVNILFDLHLRKFLNYPVLFVLYYELYLMFHYIILNIFKLQVSYLIAKVL